MGYEDGTTKKGPSIINKVLGKSDISPFLKDLCNLIDPRDIEVVVTRGKNCETLFANSRARLRMPPDSGKVRSCKAEYASHFPDLCAKCPSGGRTRESSDESYELIDENERTYIARSAVINWVDGKPATVLTLKDITAEKEANERLYTLAYIDQLSGIPNRQRLKEDFGLLEDDVMAGRKNGIIALFDLDHFKEVNDNYGHNTGDLVLRRLAEHFEGDQAFKGHLYRLGGDEFVLLYSDPIDRFITEGDMKKHYDELLATSLRAYTLPNIDVKCTLSMGVAFYPKHGTSLSDILRKSDIALYKAKSGGRNRVVFFEDQYDTAQKFKDMYINIQPVLLGVGKTFGYELFDSGGEDNGDDGTVNLSDFNRTMDALGLHDIENKMQYFITFSKQLLNPAVINNLPKDKFIVQMQVPPRQTTQELEQEMELYDELKKHGYSIALIGLNSAFPIPGTLGLADYCKFSPTDTDLNKQKKIITANQKVKFIATKVDSQEAFRVANGAGFHMFQGFYFNQPVVGKKTKEISPLKINYFRLLRLSSAKDYLDFREIGDIIASDVALSYKLLRILNSAAVGLRNVSSISSAVAYLGEETLKKWIAVLALQGIAEDKPLEIIRMSLIRARFGEMLAPHFRVKRNEQQVFMVGMLSLLHIAIEKTREQLLEEIPVANEIRDSLLTKTGVYSDLLRFYENYEYANWESVSQFVDDNQLVSSFVNDAYIAAVKWYNDLAEA